MKAPEMTDDLKADIEALQMRGNAASWTGYRKNDYKSAPKYFQVQLGSAVISLLLSFLLGNCSLYIYFVSVMISAFSGSYHDHSITMLSFLRWPQFKTRLLISTTPVFLRKTGSAPWWMNFWRTLSSASTSSPSMDFFLH